MMGRQRAQEKLFYQFRLEDHVPSDHPLRQLDAVLKFDEARTVLAGALQLSKGRPSVDPELMLRMLLIGYAYGIRSERQLCNEVHLNLAYRWFCRLGLSALGWATRGRLLARWCLVLPLQYRNLNRLRR
jgi:transposase